MIWVKGQKNRFLYFFLLGLLLPSAAHAQVFITEIMYDLSGSDTDREWVEVYNGGSEPATIVTGSGNGSWRFTDSASHVLNSDSGSETLSAGQYAVIAKNKDQFLSDWPSYSGTIFTSSISLTNSGAALSIKNGEGVVEDGVTYSSSQGANGNGFSLQKSTSGWIAASPTPGAAYSGSGGSIQNTENSDGQVLGASTDDATPSATSASAAPRYSTPPNQLEVSAGSDRLTSPGSPINLQATIKKNAASANEAVRFSWSFGDGTTGAGALVSHMYKYPGDYAVVLNASAGNISAVARLKVKVVEPKISFSNGEKYIELANNTDYEINLFNWKLVSGGKGFVFQPDTIILPHSRLKLDKGLLSMKGEEAGRTVLKNFLGEEVASLADPLDTKEVEAASLELERARATALAMLQSLPSARPALASAPATAAVVLALATTTPPPASTSLIYEIPQEKSFWQSARQFLADLFR